MYKDILRESWAYKEILQEGLEEGLEKGLEKGREEGLQEGLEKGLEKGLQERLNDQRRFLMVFIQAHFPALAPLAQKQADAIEQLEALQSMVLRACIAQNEEQVLEALSAART